MRPDLAATLAVVAGLGLGLGVMTAVGSADGTQNRPSSDGVTTVPGSTEPGSASSEKTRTERPGRPRDTPRQRGDDGQVQRHKRYPNVHRGVPLRIEIDRLGVDATVTPIDAADGSLVPPSDYTTVGWWADGPEPGSRRGTAIITGHTVHTGGGAFDDLELLTRGDTVVVERPRRDLEYVVTGVTNYEKGALADEAAEVFSGEVRGRLALVTCEDWNGYEYLSNVVVIAKHPRPLPR